MILVTGGTGMLGSHLLFQLCKSKKKVIATKRETSDINLVKHVFSYYSDSAEQLFNKISWVNADVRNYEEIIEILKNIDTVYHCAAFVSFSSKDRDKVIDINVNGTENIVNACIENNIKSFCHVSSIAALGDAENGSQITEKDKIKSDDIFASTYSKSKYFSELQVWRGISEGLNAVIVNPSVILGPGDWNKGSAKMFTTIYKGLNFYSEGITGFIDVRDVVDSMIFLTEKNIYGERFILSSENISYKNMLVLIAKKLNKKIPSVKTTKFMSEIAWRAMYLWSKIHNSSPILTKETARSAHNKSFYSSKKFNEQSGVKFKSMETCVNDIAKLFLNDLKSKIYCF